MKNKSCAFIGHRKIKISDELIIKLRLIIDELITKCGVRLFLFGSKSEFNDLCYKVVTELKEKYPYIERVVYTCSNEVCALDRDKEKWEKLCTQVKGQKIDVQYFDKECEFKNKYTSGKGSYVERNFSMIDDSDYCIFYFDENYEPSMRKWSKRSVTYYTPQSGTKLAYLYAKRKNKKIINVLE